MKFLKRAAVFFATFLIYHIIFSNFFPVDENNVLIAPDWYVYLGFFISIIAVIIFSTKQRTSNRERAINQDANTPPIPHSKKRQTELAESILTNIETCVSLANKAERVSLFIQWYDESVDGFDTLAKLNKVKFRNPPALDYYRFKDEFQWHLCDAIVRAKEATISDIKDKYKNSREFQLRAMNSFKYDIDGAKDRFSADTAALAESAIAEVREIVESKKAPLSHKPSADRVDPFVKYGGTEAELLSIDLMEGHDFEHWCAQLLSDIGFTNVRVTKTSGDQGVDVLAEKDGVRFAIQCKCYSRDLDNKPIQEVNAGKSMPEYRCQIGAVMTNRHFTQSAQAAAAANGVLLWDRDWIRNAISQRNENYLMLQHRG